MDTSSLRYLGLRIDALSNSSSYLPWRSQLYYQKAPWRWYSVLQVLIHVLILSDLPLTPSPISFYQLQRNIFCHLRFDLHDCRCSSRYQKYCCPVIFLPTNMSFSKYWPNLFFDGIGWNNCKSDYLIWKDLTWNCAQPPSRVTVRVPTHLKRYHNKKYLTAHLCKGCHDVEDNNPPEKSRWSRARQHRLLFPKHSLF